MKKYLKVLLLVAFVSLAALESQAQARLGGALSYGSEIDAGGLMIDGEFFLNNKLAISPDLLFYFDGGVWEVNGNANFIFAGNKAISVYGVAGLNLTSFDGGSELGLNAGLGSNFDVGGRTKLFSEIKYIIGDLDQAVLSLGLKFPF